MIPFGPEHYARPPIRADGNGAAFARVLWHALIGGVAGLVVWGILYAFLGPSEPPHDMNTTTLEVHHRWMQFLMPSIVVGAAIAALWGRRKIEGTLLYIVRGALIGTVICLLLGGLVFSYAMAATEFGTADPMFGKAHAAYQALGIKIGAVVGPLIGALCGAIYAKCRKKRESRRTA